MQDSDPLVRAAAAQSMGQRDEASEAILGSLTALLQDANDQVKIEAMRSLSKLARGGSELIEGLCKLLLEDDSVKVQAQAAMALAKLGPAAAAPARHWSTPRRPEM